MVHLIFIALVLCLLLIFLVKVSALNDKARLGLGIMFIILAVGIGIFTTLQSKQEAYLNALAHGFLQGKDLYINLEFKTNKIHDEGIEAIVLALAKEYHFVHPIIFSSFNYQTLKNCQRIDPHQQYCFLTKKPILWPKHFVKKNHFVAIHPHWYEPSKVTQRIWTIDNPRLAKRYFKLGVAGIFTNNFELMNEVKERL